MTTTNFCPDKENNYLGCKTCWPCQNHNAKGSRSLRPLLRRYSQTEREAPAPFHESRNNSHCEYERNLTFNFACPLFPTLEPYALILQYRPRKTNPTDYMSRHLINTTKQSSRELKITLDTRKQGGHTATLWTQQKTLWKHQKIRRAQRDILDKPENTMDTP